MTRRWGLAHVVLAAALVPSLALPPSVALAQQTPGESRLRAPDPEQHAPDRAYDRPQPAVPLEEPLNPDTYVCGRGDSFELQFWGQQNFTSRVTAGLTGRLFVSKVGYLDVAGKTLTEARTLLRRAIHRYYPGLNFDVSLASPRTFLLHVAGAVGSPGLHSATAIERLSSVIGRAGVFRHGNKVAGRSGSLRRIEIKRRSGKTIVADLLRYQLFAERQHNPFLLDGDVITVPFEGVAVTIAGGVNRPGRYELIGTRDLAEVLELAGGFQPGATGALPILVTRRDAKERDEQIQVPFGGGRGGVPAVKLRDDDRIHVPLVDELQRSIYLVGAISGAKATDEATSMQRMPFEQGDTVRTVIERAGGVGPAADLKAAHIARRRPGGAKGGAPAVIPVDLEALLVRRDFSADVKLEFGDVLTVPFRRYGVSVQGAVMRPGVFQFNPTLAINEYLAHAGGPTKMAKSQGNIRVVTTTGKVKPFKDKPVVEPGDTIVVPERTFSPGEIVQIVVAAASLIIGSVALVLAARK